MPDHYSTLGVSKTATADEIKRAYRRLASQHHPDKGGDTRRFQEIQTAYDVLSDSSRRQQYDNPSPFGTNPDGSWRQASGPHFNFDDIFSMFGTRFGDSADQFARQQQSRSARINLWITIEDVCLGGPRLISVATPNGQSNIEINVPPGIDDGDSVRYARVAPGGHDLVVTFRVKPSAQWRREGDHVHTEVLVPLWDLILGGEINLTTISGSVVLVRVPEGTQPGTVLRVRGHGLPNKSTGSKGDIMVRVQTRLPNISPELKEHIRRDRDQ